uniref:1 2-dihydroxy-3-keto-5-methylthiopentene dioxygenase n=1 Tax=Rhizophora mucronata TaxID=61149 RepID=A0A2P2K494_RHIMU
MFHRSYQLFIGINQHISSIKQDAHSDWYLAISSSHKHLYIYFLELLPVTGVATQNLKARQLSECHHTAIAYIYIYILQPIKLI